MAMQAGRLVELAGAFMLGGGIVAVGYELASPPTAATGTSDASGAPAESAALEDGSDAPETVEASRTEGGGRAELPPYRTPDEAGHYQAFPPIFAAPVAMTPEDEATYSRHAVIESLSAIVRVKPDLEAPILGLIRGGTRIRVDAERTFGGGCKQGWNRVFPRGYLCREVSLTVAETPPPIAVSVPTPNLDAPLPYEYWRVNDEMTPFFHRLPSFSEQDRADVAGQAWYAEHARTPMPTHPAERPADVPPVVKEYMNAGYYVTKAGEEVKSQRRFVRTMRGAYARKYQLGRKESPSFRGQVLPHGVDDLPIHFIRRELAFLKREAEGSDVLVATETIPKRLTTHPFVRELKIGAYEFYEDAEGQMIRAYAVSKAYKLKRPPGVGAEEPWVHIDLSEQTLVAYDGDTPVFATLVSTGKEPGMTPVGIHRIQIKHVATSMRDQPLEDEAYSIDDVPWTQYFHGSIALHGAFWHAGFGLVRSHGCVNLSPSDARWLFGFTGPTLPDGWHAVGGTGGSAKGSAVVITE